MADILWCSNYFSPYTELLALEIAFGRVWKAEGFYITPKTTEATKGYGLPKIDNAGNKINPPWGTADGPLRECIINRYENNLYSSAKSFRPYGYTVVLDAQGNAVADTLQWDVAKKDIVESPKSTWYGHWVEEVPFADDFRKKIHELTNTLRVSVGRTPVYYPIRGSANPATDSIKEVKATGYLAHNNEQGREGYKYFLERLYKDGITYSGGENIGAVSDAYLLQNFIAGDTQLAEVFYFSWVTSPVHYTNMVSDVHDYSAENGCVTSLELGRGGGTVVGSANPVDSATSMEPYDEPIVGPIAAQVFVGRNRWVDSGNYYWKGEAGTLSWLLEYISADTNPYGSFHLALDKSVDVPEDLLSRKHSFIYISGRKYSGPKDLRCYGACLVSREDPALKRCYRHNVVRVAVHDYDTHMLRFMECPVSRLSWRQEDSSPWELLTEYDLTGVEQLSIVHFSQDGTKAVFRIEKLSTEEYTDCLPITTPCSFLDTIQYPSQYYPRKTIQAFFVECTGLGTSPQLQTIAETDGVYCVISVDEHTYTLTATGTFPVAMDYVDNVLATLEGSVDDRYYVSKNPSGGYRDFTSLRELVFPSGKRFTYYSMDTSKYCTNELSTLVSIEYLDIATETVGGTRLQYEITGLYDPLYGAMVAKPTSFTESIFVNDEMLAQFTTDDNDVLAWALVSSPLTGSEVDTFYPLFTTWPGGVHGFLPYQHNAKQYTSGATTIVNLVYVTTNDAVTYCQHNVAGATGSVQYIYGGVGLYNPMPIFNGFSRVYALTYEGSHIYYGQNKEITFTDAESGIGYLAEKQIVGYHSDLDLKSIAGLPAMKNDIFPVGRL